MDWLSDFTKNWKLKKSFIVYMLASLIFSIPLGFMAQLLLAALRKKCLLARVASPNYGLAERFLYSKFLTTLIDMTPLVVIIIAFILFFYAFYHHKIQPVLSFLDQPSQVDLKDRNELTDKVFDLANENEKLARENLIHIRGINSLSKKMDIVLHEIKNPLAVLSGDIEMLTTIFRPEDEQVNKILSRMSRSENRIKTYIDKLKISENLKNMDVNMTHVMVKDLVELIDKEAKQWSEKVVFKWELADRDQEVQVDTELFLEALANIIKNAKGYAKEEIRVELIEEGEFIRVKVEDDGPGFSQEALKNYNKPYYSENPQVGSMGLGLYITDEIMKNQGIKMMIGNHRGAYITLFIKKT